MAAELITSALVSTFVERTIDNLASRFGDIFRGKKSNKKQLSNLKTKLLAVDVVADDAEQKQFTNPRVRDWLLAAKDVVFDAEDLLDEIDYALSKSQVEAESQNAAKKVWNYLKSSFVTFFENEIESRMEQVIEDLEDLAAQSHVLGLKEASGVGVGSGSGSKLSSTSLPNESVIYGRDDDKEFVFNWLTSDTHNNLSILSIVGMGGVGKTTLVQHVFNDPRMDEAKFDVKAWVCVSDEFDVSKVSRAILEAVTKSTDDSRDLEMVHRRLKEELTEKKFLLVLDDVWNENKSKWEDVRKPLVFGAQGSRILVTTRSKEVASTVRSKEHSLEQLQEDHCWKLFAKHAFRDDDDTQPNTECREIGMKIVKKCKGLPLALKTMGSLLYNKSPVSEWESVFQSEIWEFSKERCDIIPALAMSYIHLPSHLKACFAYCALFPKDYEFEKKRLIQLWMTENFLHYRQQTPEEVVQRYFNDLLSRSFFQQSGEKEEVFVMHDLLNDLAKYVGGDIYFRLKVDQEKHIQKVTRHFSVEFVHNQYFDGFGTSCDTKRLRTFMPTSRSMNDACYSWHCTMSVHELFTKFKFLRILSLSHCSDLKEVPDSVGNLEHLRSLDLSYTAIRKLSEKISSLTHLQILKLSHCDDLEELPSNLHLLTNLCRLELIETKLRKVPEYLGKLKNLKVMMSSFNVGHRREFCIQRLGELNLDGSLSIGELQNIENPLNALEADLKNKTPLVDLELKWGAYNRNPDDLTKEGDVIENLQPSKNLKKLSIIRYGGKQFPNWLLENSLWNMVSLVLEECESCQLPPLGLLPFLKDLTIAGLDGIMSIDTDFHGNKSSSFKSLETLVFSNMRQWKKWECQAMTGAFPHLQNLSIRNCPKLKGHLPEQLVPLKSLEVFHCEQLEASTVSALEVRLGDCGKLQLDWATTKWLEMFGHNMEASFLEMVGHIISDTSLEHLHITYSCPLSLWGDCNCSISDDSVSLRTFPLYFFPTLKTLNLSGFGNLEMISQDHAHNHLQYLRIRECPKLESLPGNMHKLLPSLMRLQIYDCPRLESFPDGGLPSNLKEMTLNDCSRLIGSLKGAFGDNPSLKALWIEKVDAEYFPDEGLLPLSLTSLTISDCPNLKKLDYKGLYQLSSLKNLVLNCCPNLQRLPEEGLPKSISEFSIWRNCPLLKQRCQKQGGEDWEKIAHIQNLCIW